MQLRRIAFLLGAFFNSTLGGCLESIFRPVPSTNSCGDKGLKPLVYVDHWSGQSSNFGFSDIPLD